MAKRQAIPRKLRFEVFKRDSFTCQYCGASAPNVILEADHVAPVTKGGTNDLLNLVTACRDCNGGKGATELSDDSAVQRQKSQLHELSERRLQIEMMLEWRSQLEQIEQTAIDAVAGAINKQTPNLRINETGRRTVASWLKTNKLPELLDAIDVAFNQYLVTDGEGHATSESWNEAFNKVPGILRIRKASATKPYLKDLFYIRGILRNRLPYLNERTCLTVLENAVLGGLSTDTLKSLARAARSWTEFQHNADYVLSGDP